MKKKYWILLVIGFVMTGCVTGYYLLDGQKEEAAQLTASGDTRIEGAERTVEAAAGPPAPAAGSGNSGRELPELEKTGGGIGIETETGQSVKTASYQQAAAGRELTFFGEDSDYSYRKGFRDPFADYLPPENTNTRVQIKTTAGEEKAAGVREEKKEAKEVSVESRQVEIITPQSLRDNLPFKLKGIVGSSSNWLTIIEEGGGTRICRTGDLIEDYKILKIREDSLTLSYRSINFKLELRSGLGGR